MVLGGLAVALGLIGMIATSGSSNQVAVSSTTTTPESSLPTTTIPSTTTTHPPETTTTVPPSTTTTIDPATAIAEFVEGFADAIGRGDVDMLMATLHPAVIEIFGEELCRTFVEDEILALDDYRLVGSVDGPTVRNIGSFSIDMYTGPVAFVFQGEAFESDASFASEETVTWFTECR
jgi:hypothetical protein